MNMNDMIRLFGLLLATAQLTSCSAVAGLEHHDDDDQKDAKVTHLRSQMNNNLDARMQIIQKDLLEIKIREDELDLDMDMERTQAILSDYEFTRSLRDALQSQTERRLSTCIARGESCAVGDGFCCDGLKCGHRGKCIRDRNSNSGATQTQTQTQTASKPTKIPTKKPTRIPTPNPIANANQLSSNQYQGGFMEIDTSCKERNGICFNLGDYDMECCSQQCDSNGRCKGNASQSPTPNPTTKPTSRPTGRPVDPTPPPTTKPTSRPTGRPIDPAMLAQSLAATGGYCDDPNQIKITVEVSTDRFGGDTGWSVTKPPFGTEIMNVPNGTYGLYGHDVQHTCVTPGVYNFTITDRYGDGICCAYGEGYVKIYLDEREVMHVKFQHKSMSEILNVGYDPNPVMTDRDYLYLEAHNSRRMVWFMGNEVEYVPLVYSPMLAEESRVWAEELLVNCSSSGIEHEPGVEEGENLAKNTGMMDEDGLGWGQLYPPHNITNRWVEFEVKRPYPGNAHLTQALWRPSKYLGCGEAERPFRGGMCRVQVCRYARAGNCEMARYNSTVGRNWLPPMLADTSRCGPNCPPEGCF